MRLFEFLVMGVVLLMLLSYFFSGRKWLNAFRVYAPLVAVGLVILHLIIEKTRWQMVPLYGLVFVLACIGLIRWIRRTDETPSRRGRIIGRGLALLGLVVLGITAFILVEFPVVRLPEPTGPYAVGTTYLQFADPARPETFTDDPDDFREFRGRVWYPAERPRDAEPMQYQDYQPSIKIISTGGAPEFIFSHFHLLTANSYLDAPVSGQQASYPVLVFSIGFLTLYEDYQIIAEELASQGYIVLILDTPYEWQGAEQVDGSVVHYSEAHAEAYRQHEDRVIPLWEDFWDDDTDDSERSALARQILETDTFMDSVLRVRVADIRFAVDELEGMNLGERESLFAGKLDLSRLGIVGHSMGGAVAGQMCLEDARFGACVNLDGFQWGDVVDGEISQPFMIVYSEPFEGSADFILNNLKNTTYLLTVEDSTHMNFMDMGVVIPGTKIIGMVGAIDPDRMHRITNDYLLAFFGKYLLGKDAPLLDAPSPDYPEVEFTMQD